MKRIFIYSAALAAMMALNGCGAGTTKNAQSSLNTSSLNTAGIASALNTVITELLKNTTSAKDITGTWIYTEPKIVFESENILNQLGSSVISTKLEDMLSKQLGKVGFDAGKSSLTFQDEQKYKFTIGKKEYTGTYTYDAESKKMTMQGSLGLSTMTCTATIKGNELYMLFDADKLLTFVTGFSGTSSSLSTLSKLLSSYNGLKLGWTMTREK